MDTEGAFQELSSVQFSSVTTNSAVLTLYSVHVAPEELEESHFCAVLNAKGIDLYDICPIEDKGIYRCFNIAV